MNFALWNNIYFFNPRFWSMIRNLKISQLVKIVDSKKYFSKSRNLGLKKYYLKESNSWVWYNNIFHTFLRIYLRPKIWILKKYIFITNKKSEFLKKNAPKSSFVCIFHRVVTVTERILIPTYEVFICQRRNDLY